MCSPWVHEFIERKYLPCIQLPHAAVTTPPAAPCRGGFRALHPSIANGVVGMLHEQVHQLSIASWSSSAASQTLIPPISPIQFLLRFIFQSNFYVRCSSTCTHRVKHARQPGSAARGTADRGARAGARWDRVDGCRKGSSGVGCRGR